MDQTNVWQGVKLRSLAPESEESDSELHRPLCAIPLPGSIRLISLEESPLAAQFAVLEYNHQDITAYSACWDCRILSLHAHKIGEKLECYKGHEKGTWIYFPLEEGEKIAEIWKYGGYRCGSALIVSNLGTYSNVQGKKEI